MTELEQGAQQRMNDARTCTQSGANLAHDVPQAFSGWQPIETAPKDGSAIIVWDDSIKGEAYFDNDRDGGWWWANTGPGDYTAQEIFPTMWHPMPEGPK